MNIVAGCDVGSLTSKAVIIKNGRITGSAIIKSKANPRESADAVIHPVLSRAGLNLNDIEYCVGTGYGRKKIEFVDSIASEIACHGKGAKWLVPSARTVIDIGGQDCKAMKLDENGKVVKFVTNDKCASGTGRFLEVMAKILNIELDELGKLSAKSQSPITFTSTCTVWAQADVIKHIHSGRSIEDIGAGINNAMAGRIGTLANTLKIEKEICITGGVAKNSGVLMTLEKLIGHRIKEARKADPQLAGAIGAALIANEMIKGSSLT
jgi:predicted CoA-substrate-specific enzyme activase